MAESVFVFEPGSHELGSPKWKSYRITSESPRLLITWAFRQTHSAIGSTQAKVVAIHHPVNDDADAKAIGVVEAKPKGHTLTGVETQSGKYLDGHPAGSTDTMNKA